LVTACAVDTPKVPSTENKETPAAEITPSDLGPTKYDASGTMPCSAGNPSFDEVCGWRVIRDGSGGAEIWISNIASEKKPAYRVLVFSDGEFTSQDGTPLEVSKEGDMWTVSAEDGGYFQFPDAVITGG
jgi:hypothetical protein